MSYRESDPYQRYREANAYINREFDVWNKKENGVEIPIYGIASEQKMHLPIKLKRKLRKLKRKLKKLEKLEMLKKVYKNWAVHNILSHPLMYVINPLNKNLAKRIHDITIPD